MAYDDDFFDVAQEVFGLDEREAGQLYDDLAATLDTDEITVLDLYDYGDVASDIVDDIVGDEYEDDDEYGDDEDWYEAGEEIEVTVELEYDAVPS